MSDFASVLKNFIEKIPELGFDLVSRMLPGGIVLAAVAASQRFSALGITTAKPSEPSDIVVFLVFAYAVGLAVSALARLCSLAAWFVIFPFLRWGRVRDDINGMLEGLRPKNFDCQLGWDPVKAMGVLDFIQDYIKLRNSEERSLIIKLVAEVGLLYNLALAVFFAALLLRAWSPELLVTVSLALLAAVIRSERMWYRHRSFLNNLLILPPGPKDNTHHHEGQRNVEPGGNQGKGFGECREENRQEPIGTIPGQPEINKQT